MEQPINPYVIGNSVGNSSAFVGRVDILREVLNVLRHPQQNAIVLFGQRRIGKTSVLRELEAKLPEEGIFLPVFFDLEDKAKCPLKELLQELAFKISDVVLDGTTSDLGNEPEKTFRDIWLPNVLKNLPTGKSLVLLFDEFDALAAASDDEQANVAFFPYLRILLEQTDQQRLSFVFAIGRNIEELIESIVLSLFKKATSKRVSLLNREDTVKLIRFSEANHTLQWSNQAIEQVWKTTNGHPLMTQCLCTTIWNAASDNNELKTATVTSEKVETAIPNTVESIEHIMKWLWEGLGPSERVAASVLAGAGADSMTETQLKALLKRSGVKVMIQELDDAPHLLEKGWDLIESVKPNSYRFRVELLRQWIEENEPISRVRQEIDSINPEASKYYQAGMNLYERGQWEEASKYLRDAIGKNPNHAKASDLLANILLEQGQIDESCQIMGQLYKYQPVSVQSQFIQKLFHLAENEEDESKQLKIYELIGKLDSEYDEIKRIWEQRGDEAYEAGKLETALENYKKSGHDDKVFEVQWKIQCQALPSDKISQWFEQAAKALRVGDVQKAQSLFTRILAKEPTHKKAVQELYSMNMPIWLKRPLFLVIALVIITASSISGGWLLFEQKQDIQKELTRLGKLPKRLKNLIPTLELGTYAVVVGSYGNKFKNTAERKVEEIQKRYPEIGAGKFDQDDEYWTVYLGDFYTKESAQALQQIAIKELGIKNVSIFNRTGIEDNNPAEILENFVSTFEQGNYVVVVSSYGRIFNTMAEQEVAILQKLYPELGAGKFLDDNELWNVHLGDFYTQESANNLEKKAKEEMNFPDAKTIKKVDKMLTQQPTTLSEFLGTLSSGSYIVIVGTYASKFRGYAQNEVERINALDEVERINGLDIAFKAKKFKKDKQWLLSVGGNYSSESARALEQYVIDKKIVKDAYVWKR
jgi:tetratricopeptide (TPR) repeat protein